jgi:hypothetical protein
MCADPEPGQDIPFPDGKSAVGIHDASRPELTDWLQLNRGMLRVRGKQTELFISESLNVL